MPQLRNETWNIAPLFGGVDVAFAVSPLLSSIDHLLPSERAAIERSVAKRRSEFGTGRRLARQLLARHGIHEYPLLSDNDRVPVWPAGMLGSIAHCDQYCFVAVLKAGRDQPIGIGVDIEPDLPIEADLWPIIATDDELSRIASHSGAVDGRMVRLLFSAKEAAYKCLFPATRVPLEFHEMEIEFDLSAGTFAPRIYSEAKIYSARARITGCFLCLENLLFSAAFLWPES